MRQDHHRSVRAPAGGADLGSVRFDGRELVGLDRNELRAIRRQIQVVFQDPFASLDPG